MGIMTGTLWISIATAVALSLAAPARACRDVDPTIRDLIDKGQFETAEQTARRRLRDSPDSLSAHLGLAHVYAKWALQSRTLIDTEALGFAPGETGTRAITPENVDRAFRSEVTLEPELGQKAIVLLEALTERWPDHIGSRLCLLELHQVGGDHDALLVALARTANDFRDRGPETVDKLLRFGHHYYSHGEFSGARDVTAVLLEVFPQSPPLLSSMAVILIEFEELTDALDLLRQAHALAPRDSLVARNLATTAMLVGSLDDAGVALEALHALQPDQTRLLFELAVVAMADDPGNAAAAWLRYLDLHATQPDDSSWAEFARSSVEPLSGSQTDDSLLAMARALSSAQASLALPLFHALARKRPRDAAPHFLMAQAYEREKLPKHAFAELERAQALLGNPHSLMNIPEQSLRLEAGRLALSLGQLAESIKYLERVEIKSPDASNLQYMLGLAHGRAGNAEKAAGYYQRCVELPNNSAYATYCAKNLATDRRTGAAAANP